MHLLAAVPFEVSDDFARLAAECIGAVDPVRTFGTPEQKQRWLPELASGKRLSAFALTEPCAGSDLTALRTEARLDGDDYIVNGEKLFITNVVPGRTIGLVDCEVIDEEGTLVARASSTCMVLQGDMATGR